MRGNSHVRFGGRAEETDRLKGRHRASVRSDHFYASVLLENLTPVKRVSKLLGHANVHETWKTYAHIIPDDGAGDAGVRSVMESTLRDVSFLCPAEVPLGQTPRSQA